MSNQVESYQRVIDVITHDEFYRDAKAILLQIAKTNPQIVVDAADTINGCGKYNGMSKTVIDCLYAGQKIQAIKQHRIDTGLGLKEAKDAVEAVIDKVPAIARLFHRSY